MSKYIIRRLLQAIPTFFGITLIVYVIMLLTPGDPVSLLAFDPTLRQDERDRLAMKLGVTDPFYIQYLRWLIGDDWMMVDSNLDGELDSRGDNYGILRGDFGKSFKFRGSNPLTLISERLGATIELNIASLCVSIVPGIAVGVYAAIRRRGRFDRGSRLVSVLFIAAPTFWVGMLLIIVFGIELPRLLADMGIGTGRPILPMGGRCPPIRGGCPPIYDRLHYIILPALTSSLGGIAVWSRYMRSQMLETLNSDYMRTARAKGLTQRGVWLRHGLRNAIIPLTVFLGPIVFGLIGGSIIIERVFTWPGVGLLLFDALYSRDYPVIMASVVIGAVLAILGYIFADILYAACDPRVRFQGGK